MKKVRSFFNYGIKIAFLGFFIILANVKVGSDVNQIYSGANNRVTNLAMMSWRLEENQKNDLYNPINWIWS